MWSKDGKRLLAGVNTNVLLLLEYPAFDRYVEEVQCRSITGFRLVTFSQARGMQELVEEDVYIFGGMRSIICWYEQHVKAL